MPLTLVAFLAFDGGARATLSREPCKRGSRNAAFTLRDHICRFIAEMTAPSFKFRPSQDSAHACGTQPPIAPPAARAHSVQIQSSSAAHRHTSFARIEPKIAIHYSELSARHGVLARQILAVDTQFTCTRDGAICCAAHIPRLWFHTDSVSVFRALSR